MMTTRNFWRRIFLEETLDEGGKRRVVLAPRGIKYIKECEIVQRFVKKFEL